MKCSRQSVQYAIERFATTGSDQNRARTWRKRITTDRQDCRQLRESLKNRKRNSSKLSAELSLEINRPVSARTIRRRLHAADLKGCKARKKPWLSDINKKGRYEWALKYRSFNAEDWSNVVWSDELNFEVS